MGADAMVAGANGHLQGVDVAKVDKLVGFANFKRSEAKTGRFPVHAFHHVEFWAPDATNACKRFQLGLGMAFVAKSDQSTGNSAFASYVLRSHDLLFVFTAPYARAVARKSAGPGADAAPPHGMFDVDGAYDFLATHGLGVRAVGIEVADAAEAYRQSTRNGAVGVHPPEELTDGGSGNAVVVAEVRLYGDVVLRYVSGDLAGRPFLPGYQAVAGRQVSYGLRRLDHAVGNVPELLPVANYILNFTGFHEFAEFTAEDVGTVDSGLNSLVTASDNELVLLPVNEPTFGTRRKSQIQMFLEQNEGPGLQHLALKTDDIVATLREMRRWSDFGGFEFMPRPSKEYYRKLPGKIGDALSSQQYRDIEDLGILADRDDQGVLLQIFTKPVSDRPTLFLEIIQRVGCMREEGDGEQGVRLVQAGGCGGFGKGNFGELFKSIEDYEKGLHV